MPKQISLKTASAAYEVEKKASMCSDVGSAPLGTQSFGIVSESVDGTKIKPKRVLCQRSGGNVAEQSRPDNPLVSSSLQREITANRSNSPVPDEVFFRSLFSAIESSDDQDLDPIEREERLESPPGFDVLVNNASEDFIYEDDLGYLLHHDVVDHEKYGYEDKNEHDRAYPDLRISFGQEHVDEEDIRNSIVKFPFFENEMALNCSFEQKREHCETDTSYECRSGVDLRDFLKKRRVIDGHYPPTYPQIRERPHPPMVPRRHLQGRLACKIEVDSVGSRTHLNGGIHKPARHRHSHVGRSRIHQLKERRQNHLSEISGKKSSRKQRFTEESALLFTGPKTLAQIKEEKRKAQDNGGFLCSIDIDTELQESK